MLRRIICRVVDAAGQRPWTTLVLALLVIGLCAGIASRLELRTELRELLPRDSEDYRAYEKQAGRVGGGATLFVVVESSHPEANRRYIDEFASRVRADMADRARCRAACDDERCRTRCGEELIRYLEANTKDVRAFFEQNKWLYASLADLKAADEELDLRIAIRSGMVEDLGLDEDEPPGEAKPGDAQRQGGLEARARDLEGVMKRKLGDLPSGYFSTPDGQIVALRIVSKSTGMGDRGGAELLRRIEGIQARIDHAAFAPDLKVGLAGDIPNAIEEQKSLATEAIWVTTLAVTLILGGVVLFYRSLWSLIVIGLPVTLGAAAGYAYATLVFGYVNTVGAFLGAIIIGNGINYPIVLLSRYRDFRARGVEASVARREAVLNAFRAELVGASVAAIAYGSLTVTDFRGFSQFGAIGFFGMFAVWLAIIPLVPALVVLIERAQVKLPRWLRDPAPRVTEEGASGPVSQALSHFVARFPWAIVLGAGALVGLAVYKLPGYLADPWEYNFSKLGSERTKSAGAGAWSSKADKAFGGRSNVSGAMMVADRPEQVPLIEREILAKDARSGQQRVIADVLTIWDLLPGSVEEQRAKLEVIGQIRDRLTPRVVGSLEGRERELAQELAQAKKLQPITPKDLPELLRRRFEENDGTLGSVYYVKYADSLSMSDGKNLLRIAAITESVDLPDGTRVITASRPGVFAEMIRSMSRDGPLATAVSFLAVCVVIMLATGSLLGAATVLVALLMGVVWMVGAMALLDVKLNFLNFIALPITFGIGCEYPFNLFDRARLLRGDVSLGVRRSAGPVALCSYTTLLGYGSLVFADNQALQSFGWVAASGELACTASALVVLPAILHLLNRSPRLRTRWQKGWARRSESLV